MKRLVKKRHIWLLGPPGVGKYSVGKILTGLTHYPLFDNAKTIDIALLIYKYSSNQYRLYRDDLRFSFYKKAVKSEIEGLISTCCIRQPTNWNYIKKIDEICHESGWEKDYYFLDADKDMLIKRVESNSRKWKNSLSSRKQIEELLIKSPTHSLVKGRVCAIIDTTHLKPNEVANQILNRLDGGEIL